MNNLGESIVAIICEGNSEKYYINILLENDLLIINKEDILTEAVLPVKYKKANIFQEHFLTMTHEKPISIFLIQDSDVEMKAIKEPYRSKVCGTYFFITSPEIEMLMVHHFNMYDDFIKVKSKKKPCEFLAGKLKVTTSKLKSKQFIEATFCNPQNLVEAIKKYSEKSPYKNRKNKKNRYQLIDLIKKNDQI
ncbi:hypothetical protein ACP3DM_001098 [Enterococcus faecium]